MSKNRKVGRYEIMGFRTLMPVDGEFDYYLKINGNLIPATEQEFEDSQYWTESDIADFLKRN